MTDDPSWRPIFGHDEPYPAQADGIETVREVAREGGYAVVEGACGTGKTMLALTAGIDRVRDPESPIERVLVLTSVKQQLRQFEEDLRTINGDLPDDWRPVSGLTLVGKADVCPYSRERLAGIDDRNVYDRCETLREHTRAATGEGGATTAANLAARARSQQVGLADSGRANAAGDGAAAADFVSTAGEMAPYPPELPEYDGVDYCPFYAEYLDTLPEDAAAGGGAGGDDGRAAAVPFDVADAGLLTPGDLVGLSVSHGTCPHSMMGALLAEVEVVVANYYHAFDPTTVAAFTGGLLEEGTFVVCDEAHMLEPRVRSLVSRGVADATLRDAEAELTRVIQPLEREDAVTGSAAVTPELARAELAGSDVTRSDLERVRSFLGDLRAELDRRVREHLDGEHPGWRADPTALPDAEIPLRDPAGTDPDGLTEWATEAGHAGTWHLSEDVGALVARILDAAEDEQIDRAITSAGRVLAAWGRWDHDRYFREIELERTVDETEPPDAWRRAYTARLSLHDCLPGEAIAEVLDRFAGGVLMSATLQPFDALEEVTGLARLEEKGRPVVERSYGLEFPAEHRASFAVDAPKFTYDNRGPPPAPVAVGGAGVSDESGGGDGTSWSGGGVDSENVGDEVGDGGADGTDSSADTGAEGDADAAAARVRQLYADLLRDVARSPGNVLVGMPSYREAEWAAAVLDAAVEKAVLLDESSDDAATQALKDEFFAGGPKVLVTSLRGTLTEGVDYRGDRLAAAAVCGVPIVNTSSPRTRAVRAAYDRAFDDGFHHALVVPAVRKARQAVGRVIRGPDERGVRVLVDARYARDSWDGVTDLLSADEREEFRRVSPDMLSVGLERFWDGD